MSTVMNRADIQVGELNEPPPHAAVTGATAVPIFIGHTERADNEGRSLRNVPWRIGSMVEYRQYFGEGGHFSLYLSMQFHFRNGGGPCCVVSVGDCVKPREAGTEEPPRSAGPDPDLDVTLCFELSQDEEHARLSAQVGGQLIDLGERVHHYSLVTLARLRLRDQEQGRDDHSQGWVALDDLARMLGADPSYVNIQIFRARSQVANALPPHAQPPVLVERRRGQLRWGGCSFSIRRGAVLEGRFTAPETHSPG